MNKLFFYLLFIAVIKTSFGQFNDVLKLSHDLLKEDTNVRKSYIMSRSQYNNSLPSSYKYLSLDLYSQYIHDVKKSFSTIDSLSAFNQDTLIINNISYHKRFGTLKSYDGHLTFTLVNKDSSITTNVSFIYSLNTARYFITSVKTLKKTEFTYRHIKKTQKEILKKLKTSENEMEKLLEESTKKSEDVFKQIEEKLKKAQPE